VAQLAAQRQAVESRQKQVQNDRVVRIRQRLLQARRAVGDVLDGVAAALEELGDVRRDVGVVFDQQQVHGVTRM
jgi:hypothetical protein